MAKFAANLSMLFTEVDFMDRFEAAADAGFQGVEYLFPYAFDAQAIKQKLVENNLEQVLFNLPAGDWEAGDRGIAVDPVRVEHSQVSALSADTLLSNTAKVSGKFNFIDTLVLGLSMHNSLVVGPFAATSAHSDTVDHESLLSLVSKLVSLVSSGRSVDTDHLLVLTVLPGTNTKQEAKDITLLLSPHFLEILIGSHFLY